MPTPTSPPFARPERQSAFTLIEILVVVAIIAIVAALLFPAVARAKSKAQDAKWKSDVRQTNLVTFIEADENSTFFPFADDGVLHGKKGTAPMTKTNAPAF